MKIQRKKFHKYHLESSQGTNADFGFELYVGLEVLTVMKIQNFRAIGAAVISKEFLLEIEEGSDIDFIFDVALSSGLEMKYSEIGDQKFETMRDALGFATESQGIVALEGANHDEFEICKVFGLGDHTAMIKSLSAKGVWGKNNLNIGISSISSIVFRDPYCEALEKYFYSLEPIK